ncbi:hypothetical protein D3C83_194240 [compost metagenome]
MPVGTLASGRFSSLGLTISWANRIMPNMIIFPTGFTAARCSRDLRTTRAIPTLPECERASRINA